MPTVILPEKNKASKENIICSVLSQYLNH